MTRLSLVLSLLIVAQGSAQQWVNHELGYDWDTPKSPVTMHPSRYQRSADSLMWIGNRAYQYHYGCFGQSAVTGYNSRWYTAITAHYGCVTGHFEPGQGWTMDFYTDNTPGVGRFRTTIASTQINVDTPRTTQGLALLRLTDAVPVVAAIARYGLPDSDAYTFLNGVDGPRRVVVAFGNRHGFPRTSQEISSVYMRAQSADTIGMNYDFLGNSWIGGVIVQTAQERLERFNDGANYGYIGDYGKQEGGDSGAPSFELVVPQVVIGGEWHSSYRGPVLFGIHFSNRVDDCPGMFRTEIQASIDGDGTYAERPVYYTGVIGDLNGDGFRTRLGDTWLENDAKFLQDWIDNDWPYCWVMDFGKASSVDPEFSVRGMDGVIDDHDYEVQYRRF